MIVNFRSARLIPFSVLFAVSMLIGQAAHGDVHWVPSQYSTIQSAIDVAADGDEIYILDGVYTGDGNRDIRFHGKAITVRSWGGPDNCIIDAGGTKDTPFRGFIFDSGETRESVLEGFTIRGGDTLSGAVLDQFNGGGLFFLNSSATIRNCVIAGNKCGCWGGGVYVSNHSSPLFINCDISDNETGDDGGGFFMWGSQSSAMLVNCCLSNNRAPSIGGAVCEFGSDGGLTFINCLILNNEANFGSAIYGPSTIVKNSIVWGKDENHELIYHNGSNGPEVENSIVDGGYEFGVGIVNADPGFNDVENGDYRLTAGSPAIDAGDTIHFPIDTTDMDNDGDVTEPLPFDMNYRSRFVNDPATTDSGSGGVRLADLGPFEFQIGETFIESESFELVHGTHVSGSEKELRSSDDSDLSIRRSSTEIQPQTEFTVTGTSPVAFPVALSIEIESSVFSRTQVFETVELFDFQSQSWHLVSYRIASRFNDSTFAAEVPGPLARFVESGTNEVKAKVRFNSTVQRESFSSSTDLFSWTIE